MTIYERHIIAREIQNYLDGIQWPNNAQEPDYVAKLVEELPNCIMNASVGVLSGRKISVGNAFIHQKPLAHFTTKVGYRDPELGDLLIVCRDNRVSGYCYNAMLLQAKRTTKPFLECIPNDHQYILYSEWPEFEYKRAGYLNGKIRNIRPKTITQGAQYLLIDESLLDTLSAQAKANPRLRQNYDLRNSEEDNSQRMLNALEPGTVMPIHRHRNSSESIAILRGKMLMRFYDDKGAIIEEVVMEPNGNCPMVQVEKGRWHSLEVLEEGTVVFEAKDGAWEPITVEDIIEPK